MNNVCASARHGFTTEYETHQNRKVTYVSTSTWTFLAHPNPPHHDRKIKYVSTHKSTWLGKKQQKPGLHQAARNAVGNYLPTPIHSISSCQFHYLKGFNLTISYIFILFLKIQGSSRVVAAFVWGIAWMQPDAVCSVVGSPWKHVWWLPITWSFQACRPELEILAENWTNGNGGVDAIKSYHTIYKLQQGISTKHSCWTSS